MLKPFDIKTIAKLAKLSEDNDVDLRCSHVSALYYKKRLLSLGVNQTKTHPLSFRLSGLEHKKYLHAEINCLKNTGGDLRKSTLYVVRVDRNGRLAQSKPCKFCEGYIKERGVGRVVYSIDGGIVEG